MPDSSIPLCCPLDGGDLTGQWLCRRCGASFPKVDVDGTPVVDLRAIGARVDVSLTFSVPAEPVPAELRRRLLTPKRWPADLLDRETIRSKYGTKLHEGFQLHLRDLRQQRGDGLRILDHGCGSGGNKRYLQDLGFHDIVGVDWWSAGASYLADAHRLPFPPSSFDLVLSTAVLEHCYFPHLAMREIARVLRPGGVALMGVSFWESWHGESFFHFTPNGVYALCQQAGLQLEDLWSGWGFIPAVLSHAVSSKLKRTGYRAQTVWDAVSRRLMGEERAYEKKIRTSGSLQFRADRPR